MVATAHAIVGGAIVSSVPDPVLGLAIATLSHPVLDMVPHWDLGRNWTKKNKLTLAIQSLADLFLGFIATYLIFYNSNIPVWYFWSAVFLSTGWDVATGPYMLFKWRFPPFSWLYKFQSRIQSDTDFKTGMLIQGIFVAGVVVLVKFFL